MTAFMVSLAGVPPTGGFWGKLCIFAAAIDRGGIGVWLAAIMVVNSVISVGYYFLIPRAMIFEEPPADEVRMRARCCSVTVVRSRWRGVLRDLRGPERAVPPRRAVVARRSASRQAIVPRIGAHVVQRGLRVHEAQTRDLLALP